MFKNKIIRKYKGKREMLENNILQRIILRSSNLLRNEDSLFLC